MTSYDSFALVITQRDNNMGRYSESHNPQQEQASPNINMESQQATTTKPPDTKKMVQQLEETTGIAADMMTKLHEQGDQMNRIMGVNEETADSLFESKRLARQLTFRGRISNLFRKKQRSRSLPTTSMEATEQHKDDKKEKKEKKHKITKAEVADPADDPFQGHPSDLSSTQLEMVKEQDSDLDQMSNMLSALKEMTIATQSELNSQTKKIDHIDKQVDNNLYSIQKTNRKIS